MGNERDMVVYRFERADNEARLSDEFELGPLVPQKGDLVSITGVPGCFEVVGFRWRLHANVIPQGRIIGAIMVGPRDAVMPGEGLFEDDDPLRDDPDGGDPRDRW